ncbi:MAG: relaxase/mobilization nuclease domain-containing protein [Candidatus Accumulibacter sp.]|uniref:relaxase/mobilization nuclease domain-containing protein n=1 Tax=Accumulibacter sp. TaxID=2053492 RepID=UPI0025EE2124|nr:relaxase/mobilization nuclease domain-containing protein [Accumulibacter sp.]MCM8597589.1 relaxase/mobilization nuclease domain-containing protein [Accumulibacter sp.]
MIARGQIHSSGPKLAAYLTTGKEGERAELVELRGVLAEDIRGAFADLQHIAALTKAEKPFFHAHIRLPDDERLTREQWLIVADRMEKALGFEGQARAIAFHRSDTHGDHLHVAWNRIDLDTLKAIDPGLFALKMRDEARKLEAEFGLRQLSNEPRPDRLTKAAKQGEFEQAKRLDTDLDALRNGIRQAWNGSDNGPSLAAALEQQGMILARGDRRDFVVIDAAGGEHALGKRVCGVTAGEVKQRLGGEDFKRGLPSVAEARATQRAREEERERGERHGEQGESGAGPFAPQRQESKEDEARRKQGGKEAPGRVTVATTDGGMVAQQREAARELAKRQWLEQFRPKQDGPTRTRGR